MIKRKWRPITDMRKVWQHPRYTNVLPYHGDGMLALIHHAGYKGREFLLRDVIEQMADELDLRPGTVEYYLRMLFDYWRDFPDEFTFDLIKVRKGGDSTLTKQQTRWKIVSKGTFKEPDFDIDPAEIGLIPNPRVTPR